MQKQLRVNNQIRIPEVRVIDENGTQLGVMRTLDALSRAKEHGYDLVEVDPNSKPPLAKIMDYGKYIYQKEKQEKKSRKAEKEQGLKNIKIGFKTGDYDLKYRAQQVDKFLNAGHMVKLDIFLRGRERAMIDMSKGKLEEFLKLISVEFSVQNPIKKVPSGWTLVIKKAKK